MKNEDSGQSRVGREDNLIKSIQRDYANSRNWRSQYDTDWSKYHDYYKSIHNKKRIKTRNKIFVPETNATIETIVPQHIMPLMDTKEPIITIMARHPDFEENALSVQNLLEYQFDISSVLRKLVPIYKQAIMYGTGIIMYKWDTRIVERLSPYGLIEIEEGIPNIEPVNIYDFFIDPNAIEIQDARYIILRKVLSPFMIMDLEKEGIYDLKGESFNDDDEEVMGLGIDDPPNRENKQVEVLIYFTRDVIVHLIDNRIVARVDENIYGELPFIMGKYIDDPFIFYGIGVCELIADLQEELNLNRNQMYDQRDLTCNSMTLFDTTRVLRPEKNMENRAGKWVGIHGNPSDVVRQLVFPDTTQANMRDEQIIKNDIRNVSGSTELIRGISESGGSMTATEAQMKEERASTRFDLTFRSLSNDLLIPIARSFIRMTRKFGNDYVVAVNKYMSDRRYVTIRPENICGDYDYKINVDANRSFEAYRRETALQIFQLLVDHKGADQEKLLRFILERFRIPSAESFVIPLQQVQQSMQQQAMQERATQQQDMQEQMQMQLQQQAIQQAMQPQQEQ